MLLHAIRHYETKGESASFVRKRTNPEWIERVTWPSSSICKWRETVRCAARIQYCIKLWQLFASIQPRFNRRFWSPTRCHSPLPLFKVILEMSRIVINWKIYYVYEVMSGLFRNCDFVRYCTFRWNLDTRFCNLRGIPLKKRHSNAQLIRAIFFKTLCFSPFSA